MGRRRRHKKKKAKKKKKQQGERYNFSDSDSSESEYEWVEKKIDPKKKSSKYKEEPHDEKKSSKYKEEPRDDTVKEECIEASRCSREMKSRRKSSKRRLSESSTDSSDSNSDAHRKRSKKSSKRKKKKSHRENIPRETEHCEVSYHSSKKSKRKRSYAESYPELTHRSSKKLKSSYRSKENDPESTHRSSKKLKLSSQICLEHNLKKECDESSVVPIETSAAPQLSEETHSNSAIKIEKDVDAVESSQEKEDKVQDEGETESFDGNVDADLQKEDEIHDETKNDDEPALSCVDSVSDIHDEINLDLSELEELLDADLPSEYKKPVTSSFIHKLNEQQKMNGDFIEVEKTMLDDISGDHFDLLPEGWIQMMHHTGIPVYLYRPARVCTLARPYFLGSGNIYNHRIPLSALPCLQYRQVTDKLAHSKVEDCTRLIGNLRVPITKVETVYENQRSQSLDANEIRTYCQKLFPYKKVFIKRNERIKNKNESNLNEVQNKKFTNRPSLPAGTKLLSFISFERDGKGEVIRRREWIMNPNGKSYVSILHEYLQQSLKIQPVYEFKENGSQYEAVVKLNDTIFGKGTDNSKKWAKLRAAKLAIETLIPELGGRAEDICGIRDRKLYNPNNAMVPPQEASKPEVPDPEPPTPKLPDQEALMDANNIFDEIKISDPRVAEFCARTTEPSPYTMLVTCLRRNFGCVDVDTNYVVSSKHNKSNTFGMTVGKHTVSVNCRNKRDGKQRAAQLILQALHPQLETWGGLVRLYGNRSIKNAREKRIEEQEITQLQNRAKVHSPNYAILNKLNAELEKLLQTKREMKPVETLITFETPKNASP